MVSATKRVPALQAGSFNRGSQGVALGYIVPALRAEDVECPILLYKHQYFPQLAQAVPPEVNPVEAMLGRRAAVGAAAGLRPGEAAALGHRSHRRGPVRLSRRERQV